VLKNRQQRKVCAVNPSSSYHLPSRPRQHPKHPLHDSSPKGTAPQGLLPVTLTPEEGEEVRFQCARLAYLWGRAAAAGVELPLAAERSEYWGWRMEREELSLRDYTDLRHGLQVGGCWGRWFGFGFWVSKSGLVDDA